MVWSEVGTRREADSPSGPLRPPPHSGSVLSYRVYALEFSNLFWTSGVYTGDRETAVGGYMGWGRFAKATETLLLDTDW